MATYHNRTFNDFDQLIHYTGDYWHTEKWNISAGVPGGTYHFTNAANAAVSFQFPVPAIAFYYYGLIRHDKNRGLNRVCVDCVGDAGGATIDTDSFVSVVDGTNPQPVLLYFQRFSKPENHTIGLWNVPTPTIPSLGSRISLARVELEVEDEVPGFSSNCLPLQDSGSSTGISVPTFVGALVGSNMALLLLGIGLWFLSRKREGRGRARALDMTTPGQTSHLLPSEYGAVPLTVHDLRDSWSSTPNGSIYPFTPPAYHTAGIYTDKKRKPVEG